MSSEGTSTDLKQFAKRYQYPGVDTCAADGLCGTRCPVSIDTGKMVKSLREEAHGPLAEKIAGVVGSRFDTVAQSIRYSLNGVDRVHQYTGTRFMEQASGLARKASLNKLPLWNKEMPSGSRKINPQPTAEKESSLTVIYFPSCAKKAFWLVQTIGIKATGEGFSTRWARQIIGSSQTS